MGESYSSDSVYKLRTHLKTFVPNRNYSFYHQIISNKLLFKDYIFQILVFIFAKYLIFEGVKMEIFRLWEKGSIIPTIYLLKMACILRNQITMSNTTRSITYVLQTNSNQLSMYSDRHMRMDFYT